MRPHWLDRGLLVSPFFYTLCTTEAQFHRELRMLKLPPRKWPEFQATGQSHATAHFFRKFDDKLISIVTLRPDAMENLAGPTIAALLVHEAVHIWQAIKSQIGEKNPGDETEAYAIQTISQRLMEEYVRQIT